MVKVVPVLCASGPPPLVCQPLRSYLGSLLHTHGSIRAALSHPGGIYAFTCLLVRKSVEFRKKMVLSPQRKENEALISNISQIRGFDYLAFQQSERKLRARGTAEAV